MVRTLLLALLMMASTLGFSQKYNFSVLESKFEFSDGKHNALQINIYELTEEEAQKLVKKWLKKFNGKVKEKNNEFTASGCTDKPMSDLQFNITTVLLPTDDGFSVIATVDLGGAYMNSSDHKKAFSTFKSYLKKFAIESTRKGIEYQLEAEKELLKEKEKAKSKLEKEKKEFEKTISEAEEVIEKSKKSIEKNLEEQEAQKKLIKENKEVIKSIEAKFSGL